MSRRRMLKIMLSGGAIGAVGGAIHGADQAPQGEKMAGAKHGAMAGGVIGATFAVGGYHVLTGNSAQEMHDAEAEDLKQRQFEWKQRQHRRNDDPNSR